jgi:hypothetical protein
MGSPLGAAGASELLNPNASEILDPDTPALSVLKLLSDVNLNVLEEKYMNIKLEVFPTSTLRSNHTHTT